MSGQVLAENVSFLRAGSSLLQLRLDPKNVYYQTQFLVGLSVNAITRTAKIAGLPAVGTIIGPFYAAMQTAFATWNAVIECQTALIEQDLRILRTRRVASFDPNDKVGPPGIGVSRYTSGQEPLRYAIYFDNQPTATAPAQAVTISDTLNASLDLTTVTLGSIIFPNQVVTPPAIPLSVSLQYYSGSPPNDESSGQNKRFLKHFNWCCDLDLPNPSTQALDFRQAIRSPVSFHLERKEVSS